MLDFVRDQALKSVPSYSLLEEKAIRLHRNPGRELRLGTPSAPRLIERLYLARERLYLVGVGTDDPTPVDSIPEALAYLDSFGIADPEG